MNRYSCLVGLGLAASMAGFVSLGQGRVLVAATPPAAAISANNPDLASAQQLSRAFEDIQHAIKNSVVNIQVVKVIKGQSPNFQFHFQLPPGFRQMLPPGAVPPGTFPLLPHPGGEEKLMGIGSGVILRSDGYIVTNNHVVSGAKSIKVTLANGHVYTAKLVGRDPKTDLAVIKIPASHLPAAVLGNSRDVHVGQWVLAFGSPFGYTHTMTQGIISAKGRRDLGIIASHNPKLQGLTYGDFLQTDAAINPGNSGGPLVNMRGQVVGINTAIATNTGSFDGIGFAIPANEVQSVTHALIKYGKVVRGYLGVEIRNVADPRFSVVRKLARSFGYKGNHGVFVWQVEPNTPAAKAGIKRGDVIVAFNGRPIKHLSTFRNAVAATPPGRKVTLSIFRNGQQLQLTVPLGTQPATNQMAWAGVNSPFVAGGPASKALGLTVSGVTDQEAQRLNLASPEGVFVSQVDPKGLAAKAGIQPGDVIVSVQGHPIMSVAQFNALIGKLNLAVGVRMSIFTPDGSEDFVFVQRKG